jgi:2Fe-2S ferredoxin
LVKITYFTADGAKHATDLEPGTTLMEGAKYNDIEGIEAVCGGNSYCGTCRVLVSPDWRRRLAEASALERELIEALGYDEPDARLGCQITVTAELEGLVVRIPAQQG